MTSKKVIYTDKAPAPVGPYNQAIAVTGELIFVAGQIPLNAQGEMVGDGDIQAQTTTGNGKFSSHFKRSRG